MSMNTDDLRFTVDLEALLSPHDMVWERYLPSDYKLGAPIGNGDFGATIAGTPRSLSLAIGKTDVWDRRNDTTTHFCGSSYQELRDCVLSMSDQDKERFQREVQEHGEPTDGATKLYRMYWEMGTKRGIDVAHQTTCGTLTLHLDEGLNADGLTMRVCLAGGEARVSYAIGRELSALVSREYDVMMLRFHRGRELADPWVIAETYDRVSPLVELPWEFTRAPLDHNPPMQWRTVDGLAIGRQSFVAGGGYVVGIVGAGFEETEILTTAGRCYAVGRRPHGDEVVLFLTVASDGDADDPEALVRHRLDAATRAGAMSVRASHRRWWHDYWMRGLAAVGDPEVEAPYYRSLYINASTVRHGKQAPGLQGVWCGENYPVWYGDYHSNVNIQCMFWGLFANNRLELVEPFLRLYTSFADHARSVAQDYFKMRGLKFPHAASIGGHDLAGATACAYATDPSASGWIASLFWDYYRYTGDVEYLRQTAYPILRDVALFIADFLTWDTDQEGWTMNPVVHFETPGGSFGVWGRNSLSSQAFTRRALTIAIEAATILQSDDEHRTLWSDRLEKLVAPPTTGEGYWKAWEDAAPTYLGHNFMLPLVYPGELVSAAHGPEQWRKQALATWREIADNRRQSNTGGLWCGGQGIAETVRIAESDEVFPRAKWRMDPPNGFSLGYGGYGGSFLQAENIAGMSRVLADLLLLDLGGTLHLFRGIPDDLPARFASLRAPGAVLVSAEKRGKEVDYIVAEATVDTDLRIANPWPGREVRIERRRGSAHTDDGVLGDSTTTRGAILCMRLSAGARIRIQPADSPAADLPMAPFHLT